VIANALVATTAICLAVAFWLLQACTFLIPFRAVLVRDYGATLLAWASVAFVNVFAGCYVVGRTVFLKDTGDKLAHLEKQLRSGATISQDLRRRLEE
jgi:hypothetical protein